MKRDRGYSGLPRYKINRCELFKKADNRGYTTIINEKHLHISYIVDREEKVVALVTATNGYITIPKELIDVVINDLKDIKEMYL